MQALLLVALYIETILLLIALANQTSVVDVVRMSVIVVGIVPIGLLLATTVAYALGALRLVGKSALVQRLSAVESLSNVDVLCLDKTGTITTNTLVLEHVHPFGTGEEQLRQLLALDISHTSSRNATSRAIETACPLQETARVICMCARRSRFPRPGSGARSRSRRRTFMESILLAHLRYSSPSCVLARIWVHLPKKLHGWKARTPLCFFA